MVGRTILTLARVDSKGRVSLPREMHEIVGDVVEIKPVGKQSILIERARNPKRRKEVASLAKLLDKEPRRTGKPQNPSPDEMKSIWNE